MLPQVGQGALAVECRADDADALARARRDRRRRRAPRRRTPSARSSPSSAAAAPAVRRARADAGRRRDRARRAARVARRSHRAARPPRRRRRSGRARRRRLGAPSSSTARAADRRCVDVDARSRTERDRDDRVPRRRRARGPRAAHRRGAELLARADVVVYDRLAHPSLLDARAGRRRAHRRRQGARARSRWTRTRSTPRSSSAGAPGAAVVRLKGGDPFVFGRGGEEAEALRRRRRAVRGRARHHQRDRRAGLRGHPGHAPRARRRTSRSSPATRTRPRARPTPTGTRSRAPAARSWSSWARAASRDIATLLIDGRPRAGDARSPRCAGAPTRAAHDPRHARDDRRRRRRVAERDRRRRGRRRSTSRGSRRGRCSVARVVVTRAREQASELRARLEQLGAEVIELPAIALEPLAFDAARPRRVRVARVHVGQRRRRVLRPRPRAARVSTPARSPACGSPRSARAPPPRSSGAASAPTSCPSGSSPSRCSRRSPTRRSSGERVLLARAEQARDVLPEGLARPRLRGRRAARCTGRCAAEPTPADLERVRAGEVDAITFTSSSTVTNFCDLVGAAPGPAAARRLDRPDHVARPHATAGCASTSRPIRTRSTASSTRSLARRSAERRSRPQTAGSLAAWRFPEHRLAPAAPHPALRRLDRRDPALASTTSSRRCS